MNDGIFEGGFRRLPEQNLAGASKHTKKYDFLQKIHLERVNRQLDVQKNKCAILLQAAIRGFLARRKLQHYHENILISTFNTAYDRILPLDQLGCLLFAYYQLNTLECCDILTWLSKQLMLYEKDIILKCGESNSGWLWKVRWLIRIHIKKLANEPHTTSLDTYSVTSLRVLSVYTNYDSFCSIIGTSKAILSLREIFMYIVVNDYFLVANALLNKNNQANDAESKDLLSVESIKSLVVRPLSLIPSHDNQFRKTMLIELCKAFLTNQTNDSIRSSIFPIILSMDSTCLSTLVHCIVDSSIEPTTSCLYILIEFFKKGCENHFPGMMAALGILLSVNQSDAPKSSLDNVLSDELFFEGESIEEDEEDDMSVKSAEISPSVSHINLEMQKECMTYLKSIEFSMDVVNYLASNYNDDVIIHFSKFLHILITKHCFIQYKILWYVSLHPAMYKDLWRILSNMHRITFEGKSVSLLTLLSKGTFLTCEEGHDFYPLLITFCLVFKRYICMLHNDEITQAGNSVSDITEITVKLRDVAIALLNIGLPDTTLTVSQHLKKCNIDSMHDSYKAIICLLRVLHSREIGTDQSFWISKKIFMPQMLPILDDFFFRVSFFSKHKLFDEKTMTHGPTVVTNNSVKPFIILRDLPFCVPTKNRLNKLQHIFLAFKSRYQNPNELFQEQMFIKIRRDYIYEDAFEKLSPTEVPEIKINVRIQLTSAMGYEEVGVDGGGIFREFMSEFLKAAFDPNRGFFLLNKDRQLYPNPNVEVLYSNFRKHYYFIGRMLAKALYENILVELPLAECFISSLVRRETDVNLYDLHSLDPELFKNLISLRSYDGDFSSLGLNYTVVSDLYGQTKVIELIEDGEKVSVNRCNKIDYIQTVADYKLNTQFQDQISYFRQGISSVFSLCWLTIFSAKELQKLLFCIDSPIDVQDLKNNCSYTGGYSSSHPNIIRFWNVFDTFQDKERKQLLQFVTSCARQPLLGFKDLDPPFTIQLVESSDRLPTSSTCMNLLKLPIFQDEKVMKEKLLYSIQSQAGFDLC